MDAQGAGFQAKAPIPDFAPIGVKGAIYAQELYLIEGALGGRSDGRQKEFMALDIKKWGMATGARKRLRVQAGNGNERLGCVDAAGQSGVIWFEPGGTHFLRHKSKRGLHLAVLGTVASVYHAEYFPARFRGTAALPSPQVRRPRCAPSPAGRFPSPNPCCPGISYSIFHCRFRGFAGIFGDGARGPLFGVVASGGAVVGVDR